jgi:hypothetical protein
MYGQKNDMFHAYLHLCYARLYKNQKQKFLRRLARLKTYAHSDGQKKELARLEKTYKEWSQYW